MEADWDSIADWYVELVRGGSAMHQFSRDILLNALPDRVLGLDVLDVIEDVKSRLANLRERAHRLGMELNPFSNSFVPAVGSKMDPADVALAEAELQPQLTALLAEAAAIDDELAAAINMATGKTPIPTEGPAVGPQGLTPTQVTSDANQARMEGERSRVQGDVDRMQRQLDDWGRQAYMGDPVTASRDQIAQVAAKLSEQKKYLGDLDSVHEALGKADETYLTVFDPRTGTGKPVLAAVAVGNPDTAKNVSVTVPGVGSRRRTVCRAWSRRPTLFARKRCASCISRDIRSLLPRSRGWATTRRRTRSTP